MNRWPRVKLRDIAPIVSRAVEIRNDANYPELGIRSFGKGTFHKPAISGSSVGSKRLFRIEPGDLIFSNVFAWEGAVAVAGVDDDGRFGSHRFITCSVDEKRAVPAYLYHYLAGSNSGLEQLRQASPGGAGRNRTLGLEKLGDIEVPLPNLDVQRAIVSRLAAIAENTRQITLRLEAVEASAEQLLRSYVFHSSGNHVPKQPLSAIVALRKPDVVVDRLKRYQFAGVYSFGKGVFASANKAGDEFAYDRLSTVRVGDFTYPKLMAWEGGLGVVPPECDGMVVSPEFPVFSVDTSKILPEVLDVYFRTPEVWPTLAEISGGTNMRRRRLQPSAFLSYEVPVPPMATQIKIKELHKRVRTLKDKHAAIRVASRALLPATRERLFSVAT